ncbi:MAG: hypothetical protein IBJ16_07055 [Chitinophagaceae bacterium]|nr:hypothetical protein [Chitinophagaceae bacterium]
MQYYISFTDFIYVRLTLIVWVSNGLVNVTNLQKDAADLLSEIYEKYEFDKPLIIDCKDVTNVVDHSWDDLFKKMKTFKRNVFFINSIALREKISGAFEEFCQHSGYTYVKKENHCSITFDQRFEYDSTIWTSIQKKLSAYCKDMILDSFRPHDHGEMKMLSSTPFYANGEYTASKLIIKRESFIWLSICFADLIRNTIEHQQIGKVSGLPIKLLSVSLRSAPFASAVCQLLNYPLQTIEFLGPKRNILNYKSLAKHGKEGYLYIGDYSFAGTEIRITQMYSYLNSAVLKHAFVLGSLFENDRFPDFELYAMVNLQENKIARYEIFKI